MKDIAPIETVYKGYRFRSRLEARWAVYFERMGFEWHYEIEGFNLGELGYYLPDFQLKSSQDPYWFEVKPKIYDYSVTTLAMAKMARLSNITGRFGVVCFGDPLDHEAAWFTPADSNIHPESIMPEVTYSARLKGVGKAAAEAARAARFEHREKG